LSLEISPVEGGAPWAVGWKKPSFIGSEILRGQKDEGAPRVMHALVSLDRGIPRAHMSVKSQSGEVLGEITSGTFSPTLKKGIALALLSPSVSIGDHVIIDVRGRDSIAEVTKAPLVPSHVR
jgi:aminomethyltransferase